eukprot:CAMPEP_0185802314 /NCGR_PEP_ID=MMETSP1322-20130828/1934_1 /TAXON_ID=265543 /ORGANISM="Minutocellus polymorphus, Strain RCC2270" /LENGTH=216 /DNA_ID=CAMNT_0028498069 /DNA_START=54 /DNA_END=704 /DNA_ORIENTATION=-
MKFSAILTLALALPSVVDGCSYSKNAGRKCKSRSGGNGADEIILGPNLKECEVLCDRASTNGNNGPCGGYEFHANSDSNQRKCELHYTSPSGKGSNQVSTGDKASGVDCYIKKDQKCQNRKGDEGDFKRYDNRRCNTSSTQKNRTMRRARRAQCQAMCYTRPKGYDTGEQICTAFEYSGEGGRDDDSWCRLYYNGSPEKGSSNSDYRCYIQRNNAY